MTELHVKTHKPEELIDITSSITDTIRRSEIHEGLINIFVPHTTAGITINENADPDVVRDILMGLKTIVPHLDYRHMEGNSIAHIKSSLIGVSLNVKIEDGRLVLGQWQDIYFCEFDGPRDRKIWLSFH
jgi:secondary thiamine-phosphate synthase enzyme